MEAWLRPQLGQRLCVVASHRTRQELRAVREHLSAHWDEWGIYGAGEISDHQGQPHVVTHMARVLPEIARWAVPLPEGLLQLKPWLAPPGQSR